jgi:hypothetical protein
MPDLSEVKTVAGDFHDSELADVMDRTVVTGDIIDQWLKRGENRPTFCFYVNRKHAQHVAERFVEAGIAAEYMDGNTPRQDRADILAHRRQPPLLRNALAQLTARGFIAFADLSGKHHKVCWTTPDGRSCSLTLPKDRHGSANVASMARLRRALETEEGAS